MLRRLHAQRKNPPLLLRRGGRHRYIYTCMRVFSLQARTMKPSRTFMHASSKFKPAHIFRKKNTKQSNCRSERHDAASRTTDVPVADYRPLYRGGSPNASASVQIAGDVLQASAVSRIQSPETVPVSHAWELLYIAIDHGANCSPAVDCCHSSFGENSCMIILLLMKWVVE